MGRFDSSILRLAFFAETWYDWCMHKEVKIKNTWVYYGGSFKRFGLGFSIERYFINLDLLWFWATVER
jgi:hypothetical protein